MTFRNPRQNTSKLIKSHPTQEENPENQTPLFSLEYMIDGFCVSSCEQIEKAQFAMALFKRRNMTWQQMRGSQRHGLGYENIDRKSIRVGLPQKVTPEVNIIAFRCFGMMPMIGFRAGRIFNILWVDPKGKVYSHGS